MKVKDLKKDTHKSVRINSDVLNLIEAKGLTLQSYLDEKLDVDFSITLADLKEDREDCKHLSAEDALERALARVME